MVGVSNGSYEVIGERGGLRANKLIKVKIWDR